MEQQIPIEDKNSFLRNDRKLVCSMFLFYGLCILGLIGATVWGLDQRERIIAANTTSTALVVATEQAKGTATAIARRVEQAKYQMTERFDNNRKDWRAGPEDNEYWTGNITIQNGVYDWTVKNAKDSFIAFAEFLPSYQFRDFDAYVDTKIVEGTPDEVCSGMIFRDTYDEETEEEAYYYYSLCSASILNGNDSIFTSSNSTAYISYHAKEGEWENIASIPYIVSASEWNRLEISARGSHFTFLINGKVVHEMDDDRQKTGGVALIVDVPEGESAHILFDNFGFQPR